MPLGKLNNSDIIFITSGKPVLGIWESGDTEISGFCRFASRGGGLQ